MDRQLALQETVGQVVLPFFVRVEPRLLPSPLGVATWVRAPVSCGITMAARAGTRACEALLTGRHGRLVLWILGRGELTLAIRPAGEWGWVLLCAAADREGKGRPDGAARR